METISSSISPSGIPPLSLPRRSPLSLSLNAAGTRHALFPPLLACQSGSRRCFPKLRAVARHVSGGTGGNDEDLENGSGFLPVDGLPLIENDLHLRGHQEMGESDKSDMIFSKSVGGSGSGGSRAGLFRTPNSGGVQSATSAHDLPSPAIAVRNLMEQSRFAHLCTVMSRMHHRRAGYPFGSLVDFTPDSIGHPIFSLSPLAIHTRNLLADPRCTLAVQIPGWSGLSNARVTLFGDIVPLPADQQPLYCPVQPYQLLPGEERYCISLDGPSMDLLLDWYQLIGPDCKSSTLHLGAICLLYARLKSRRVEWTRQQYLAKHQQWVSHQWGNFYYYRMQNISDIYFIGGFGTVAWIDVKEYEATHPDKIAADGGEHNLKELNAIFSKPLKDLLSVEGEVDDAALISIDSKGTDIRLRQGAQFNIQRLSFEVENSVQTLEEAKKALQHIIKSYKSNRDRLNRS